MIFMPYETALEYANAINGCNDREAAEAIEEIKHPQDQLHARGI